MKKIILLLLLVLVSITASARKSYITVYAYNENGYASTYQPDYIILTGDVPNDIEGVYYDEAKHWWGMAPEIRRLNTGDILNLLSEHGYEVEFANNNKCFLLSKEIPDGQTISKGDVNTDGEVNIADVNEVISLILGIVREHPEILEQIKK